MQGYILNIQKVRDEDLLVTILTSSSIKTLYRFYGARHSTINLGYKIDFEEQIDGQFRRLRNITHIGFKAHTLLDKLEIWQKFIRLLFRHLKDIDLISKFYIELLDELIIKMELQNPIRAALESYVKILDYEGRLHRLDICFDCEQKIEESTFSILRAFLPTHTYCSKKSAYNRASFEYLFENKSAIFIDEDELLDIWLVVCEGF